MIVHPMTGSARSGPPKDRPRPAPPPPPTWRNWLLLIGVLITAVAYRRRERWAWFALWYYPLFWAAHLLGGLPPGREHVHQVVFIVLSLAGLLLPVREFFPAGEHGRP